MQLTIIGFQGLEKLRGRAFPGGSEKINPALGHLEEHGEGLNRYPGMIDPYENQPPPSLPYIASDLSQL